MPKQETNSTNNDTQYDPISSMRILQSACRTHNPRFAHSGLLPVTAQPHSPPRTIALGCILSKNHQSLQCAGLPMAMATWPYKKLFLGFQNKTVQLQVGR